MCSSSDKKRDKLVFSSKFIIIYEKVGTFTNNKVFSLLMKKQKLHFYSAKWFSLAL
jgi:hypothetical protein